MKITAGDIMTTRFHTLTPQTPVNDAVKLFKQANEEEGRKIFGMMVIDTEGQLGG
ncbi:MAG: CBS domain-containing protein [Deltaproteobacteria bacterium]|nr:CBS domain-containing protein [Deltaproteobacteria bacterium]